MAVELCACGTRFAAGFLRCPRCRQVAPRGMPARPVMDPLAPLAALPFKQFRAQGGETP